MPDERCKECGMLKPPLAIEQGDDFCSTECARRHYENSREERTPVGGQTRRGTGEDRPVSVGVDPQETAAVPLLIRAHEPHLVSAVGW